MEESGVVLPDETSVHGVTFATAVDETCQQLRCILKEVLQKCDDAGQLEAFMMLIQAIHSRAVSPDCLPMLFVL